MFIKMTFFVAGRIMGYPGENNVFILHGRNFVPHPFQLGCY